MKGIFFDDIKLNYIPNILKELYEDKIYDPFFENARDIIAYDIGANIGLVTQYMYPYCKKIVALEPAKIHFEKLQAMVEFNRMDRVQIVKKALSNSVGKELLQHSPNITMYSLKRSVTTVESIGESIRDDTTEEVETVDINTLIGDDIVDFMKIDIEGKEGDILMSDEFANASRRIKNIMLECHSWGNIPLHIMQKRLIELNYQIVIAPCEAYVIKATLL